MPAPAFQGDDVPVLVAVTIDCNDLDAMARFWASLLGVEITAQQDGFAFLAHAPDRKVTIWLQRVPEPRTGKNRVHLDLAVPDLAKTEARIIELGGAVGAHQTWEGFEWKICEDPEGNVVDVMQAPSDEQGT